MQGRCFWRPHVHPQSTTKSDPAWTSSENGVLPRTLATNRDQARFRNPGARQTKGIRRFPLSQT